MIPFPKSAIISGTQLGEMMRKREARAGPGSREINGIRALATREDSLSDVLEKISEPGLKRRGRREQLTESVVAFRPPGRRRIRN